MPSITSWTRLEPIGGRNDIDTGLQARVHDPLWMLARQWQLGEFRAEDAGSPVLARLRAEVTKVTRYAAAPSTSNANSAHPYNGRVPLEVVVEREAAATGEKLERNLRMAAEAGQQFLLLLGSVGVSKYRDAYTRTFAIQTAADVDDDARRFLAVVSQRAPDGARLFKALRAAKATQGTAGLPAEPSIEASDIEAVSKAADAFISWYEQFISEPGPSEPSPWISERMEYSFALAAPSDQGERVFVAREYTQGSLDWHAFDEHPGAALGAAKPQSPPASIVQTVIPAPVEYRGMPAARWWEFEDASVDFGAVEVPPSDLVRLLLIKFVMEYSNDWFVMPVELEVGSICIAKSLVIEDTFGQRTLIRHYSEVDGAHGKWHLFRSSIDERAPGPPRPLQSSLLVVPALAANLSGKCIEEVLLLRDEMANLAFAVERIVEGPAGKPLNRFENYQERRNRERESQPEPPSQTPTAGSPFRYRLASQIPDYWIPLVPVQNEDKRSVRLRRGRLLASSGGETSQPAPVGRILEPGKPLSLFEEEVSRSGAKISRAWQFARWIDGSSYLWIGRRKQSGRGEGSSGLRFDVLDQES